MDIKRETLEFFLGVLTAETVTAGHPTHSLADLLTLKLKPVKPAFKICLV